MTLKVRDEEDVLEANLRYHLVQGVDFFVVTDNGSTDRTPEILRRYQAAGHLHLIAKPEDDFRRAAKRWVTNMAELAATEFDADWVIHADADEFWWPLTGTLKDAFASIPEDYGALTAPRPEFVARPDGPEPFYERLVVRESASRLRPKVAHRAIPGIRIGRGSHYVDPPKRRAGARHSSRAVLRAVSPAPDPQATSLVSAPRWPARILHFPVRSFEHYRRRVHVTLYEGGFEETPRRRRLREYVEQGRLPELYAELVLDDAAVAEGLDRGDLVVDHGLRDVLTACGDPLDAGGRMPAPGERRAIDTESELEANERDAAYALDRTDRLLRRRRKRASIRVRRLKQERAEARRRIRELEREREALAARLGALESRPVPRAAAAARRLIGRPRS